MYPKYFGLSEPSFSITPDPQYLFLSEQHREALAHLLYGAGETGGFVLLTGEVGTGKTTVCRAFLEQLPEGVEVGLVLNPALTGLELMAAVCEEFGVAVPKGQGSAKAMLDQLNSYLLECHACGRRPVLIIDEAQNLLPDVLEQVRLLTNLETTKHKLLHIFLVGQPELRTLLATDQLRQLNQRITARFHLVPLSRTETAAYIRHRLSVAGVDRPLFSRAAVRRVHHHSDGVPRLINLICDRALLGAAVSHRLQANVAIVDQAAREVRGQDCAQPWPKRPWLGMAVTALTAAAIGIWVGAAALAPLSEGVLVLAGQATSQSDDDTLGEPETAEPASSGDLDKEALDAPVAGTEQEPGREQSPLSSADSDSILADPAQPPAIAQAGKSPEDPTGESRLPESKPDPVMPEDSAPVRSDRRPRLLPMAPEQMLSAEAISLGSDSLSPLMLDQAEVLASLLRIWNASLPGDARPDCAQLTDIGLACERGQGRWSDLRRFDRPAALQLTLADGSQGSVLLLGLSDEFARIDAGEGRAAITVPLSELDLRWSGDYLLLWRPPPSGTRVIGRSATPADIRWLRAQLRAWPAGDPFLPEGDDYDQTLMTQVRAFQSAQGLDVDGIAGPQTLIQLGNVLDQSASDALPAQAERSAP